MPLSMGSNKMRSGRRCSTMSKAVSASFVDKTWKPVCSKCGRTRLIVLVSLSIMRICSVKTPTLFWYSKMVCVMRLGCLRHNLVARMLRFGDK